MTETSSPTENAAAEMNHDALPDGAREVSTAGSDVNLVLGDERKKDDSDPVRKSLALLAAQLPLQLDLRVPLPSFRVQSLLAMEKGHVIETGWPHTEDLPLWSGNVQLVWTEFEVVDQKLAVRITRLA